MAIVDNLEICRTFCSQAGKFGEVASFMYEEGGFLVLSVSCSFEILVLLLFILVLQVVKVELNSLIAEVSKFNPHFR
jgi:hypothetical protein